MICRNGPIQATNASISCAFRKRVRWVAGVTRPDHPRITLTLPVLSSAVLALFLVAGEGVGSVCASAEADGPFWNAHRWTVGEGTGCAAA